VTSLVFALVLALFAGVAIPVGALLACVMTVSVPFLRTVTAFGGGALLSAVALVLVPKGAESLPAVWAIGLLLAGGIVFYLIDRTLEKRGGNSAALLAMLLDFLPEAIALGALITTESATAKVLAAMIFLQNLPEGFTSFRDIRASGKISGAHILMTFIALSALGPICAGVGFLYFADAAEFLGGTMIFAAGGILYLVFQDIAPESHVSQRWSPALGAVAGFSLGLLGELLVG